MKLPFQLNRRTLLVVLMILSAASCVLPAGVSGYLRGRLDLILSPLADGGTVVTTTLRSRLDALHWRPGSDGQDSVSAESVEAIHSYWHHQMVRQQEHYERELADRGLSRGFSEQFVDFPCELIPARVVASDALPYEQGRTIRARELPAGAMVTTRELLIARAAPLPKNLAVLSSTALVGRITSPSEFTARLTLVTDRGFRLPAQIWRDPAIQRNVTLEVAGGAQSVPLTPANNAFIDVTIKGDGSNGVVIDDLPRSHMVLPGDWIVTRGGSLEMPDHVRIAQVKHVTVHKSNSLMRVVYAEPYVDLSALREVYIVHPLTLKPPEGGPR